MCRKQPCVMSEKTPVICVLYPYICNGSNQKNKYKTEIMINLKEELPVHMQQPTKLGEEISITGKWVPTKKSGLFRKSAESKDRVTPLNPTP